MDAERKCQICGCTGKTPVLRVKDHHLTQDEFSLADCAHCGFRFTDPIPGPEAIEHYYGSQNYLSHDSTANSLTARAYRLARRYALWKKHNLIRAFVSKGNILDVGCGTGDFLSFLANRGYIVQGVEPGTRAREAAIRQHSLSVSATLDALPSTEQFHAITLWHVMEHLPELNNSLQRLHALLATDGFLFIAVPSRMSWDARHYGPYWAAWDVPRHLWHFREMDMCRVLHSNGFQLLPSRPMWLDAFYISLLSERYLGRPALIAWALALIWGSLSNFLAILRGYPTSSTLYIAKKS
jgi:SAM-dependent methyltransferase